MTGRFIDNKAYINLELGAGCGNFGATYHPKCYLTDVDQTLKTTCSVCHVHWFCDARELPWSDNRFDKVILCNPYGFGFNDEEESQILLNEIVRVSKNGSQIIIVGSGVNRYCAPERVKKRVNNCSAARFKFYEEDIDCAKEYKGFIFRMVDGTPTIPTKRMVIDVVK